MRYDRASIHPRTSTAAASAHSDTGLLPPSVSAFSGRSFFCLQMGFSFSLNQVELNRHADGNRVDAAWRYVANSAEGRPPWYRGSGT